MKLFVLLERRPDNHAGLHGGGALWAGAWWGSRSCQLGWCHVTCSVQRALNGVPSLQAKVVKSQCVSSIFPFGSIYGSCVLKLWSFEMESLGDHMEERHPGRPPTRSDLCMGEKNLCCGKLLRFRVTCCNSLANPIMMNLSFPSM